MTNIRARSALRIAGALALVALVTLAVGCGSKTTTTTTPTSTSTAAAFDVNNVTTDAALTALLPATVTGNGEIRCASDVPYPPWEMWTTPTSKQATGIDYDLSQAIGKKLGIKVAFLDTPFDSIILSIQGGKNDMVMSDMYDTADREKYLTFIEYANDGTGILVAKGNPQGIVNLDSLSGKTVACESGTTQQTLLQTLSSQFKAAGKPGITVLVLQKQPEAVLALQGGKAAAIVTDASTAGYIATTVNNGNSFELVKDAAAPHGYFPQLVGIGILKTNTQLIDAVQKALQALIDDGTYSLIVAKYGFLPVTSAQTNQGPLIPTTSPTP
jgi:polar amino acid transport system substrate-binding protein